MSLPASTPELPFDESLFKDLPASVVLCDMEENIIWVNECFLELMAAEKNSVLGAPVSALLKNNITSTVCEPNVTRYETKNDKGENLWLHCIKVPVFQDQSPEFTLRILVDITEFEHRQNIRPLVTTGIEYTRLDHATGFLNRRAIIQELDSEISRTRRYGNPLSVILFRYPLPVTMNDTEVSEVLHTIANCLNSQLRWVDKLGVLEKGEFLVVLPESDLEAAQQTWSKINDSIQDVTLRRDQLNMDYSVAVTSWMMNDQPESMLKRLNTMLTEPKVA